LGAAGAIEAILSIKMMQNNIICPTINFLHHDEECDLDYTFNKAVHKDIKTIMSNSLGFGGHNAIIILKEYGD
ncbi:MAG: beta-ketoacyl-[acyl-carrier-protein] synthase II, partial [Bacilli bacterium]|nr:beta-ketoacyl-[acyl-carrier-protein] synthase II [Bacilli bacterium]